MRNTLSRQVEVEIEIILLKRKRAFFLKEEKCTQN
jgi:hypothetical protein